MSLPDVIDVKYKVIDHAATDQTLVAAVSGKRILVTSLFFISAGTVTVRFESGTGGTALTGQMNFIANTGISLPYNEYGWFCTAKDELLNLELSTTVSIDGGLSYREVD